jgi:NADP-dependent 3-hydroxy acid dehydrogenase YdfG
LAAQGRESPFGGLLQYINMDVTDVRKVHDTISQIADKNGRLDGIIAAAGVQRIGQAIGQS